MARPGRSPDAARSSQVIVNRVERLMRTSSAEWSVLVFVTVTCVSVNCFPSFQDLGVECFGRSCLQCLSALAGTKKFTILTLHNCIFYPYHSLSLNRFYHLILLFCPSADCQRACKGEASRELMRGLQGAFPLTISTSACWPPEFESLNFIGTTSCNFLNSGLDCYSFQVPLPYLRFRTGLDSKPYVSPSHPTYL
jgi:hypothetical protein